MVFFKTLYQVQKIYPTPNMFQESLLLILLSGQELNMFVCVVCVVCVVCCVCLCVVCVCVVCVVCVVCKRVIVIDTAKWSRVKHVCVLCVCCL